MLWFFALNPSNFLVLLSGLLFAFFGLLYNCVLGIVFVLLKYSKSLIAIDQIDWLRAIKYPFRMCHPNCQLDKH
jgi:hypothetical protein